MGVPKVIGCAEGDFKKRTAKDKRRNTKPTQIPRYTLNPPDTQYPS